MGRIRRACFLKAVNLSIFFVASRVILFGCFITYVLLGNQLSATGVFVTMALFNTLRITMTWLFPQAVALGAELLVSCRRIQTFLELEEIETKPLPGPEDDTSSEKSSRVVVDRITAKWNDVSLIFEINVFDTGLTDRRFRTQHCTTFQLVSNRETY